MYLMNTKNKNKKMREKHTQKTHNPRILYQRQSDENKKWSEET